MAVLATVAVISGGALGYRQVTGGGSPPAPGTANIWVDTNGGSCTYSATPIAYNDATACGKAVLNGFTSGMSSVNTNGGTVHFAAGAYGGLSIKRPIAVPDTANRPNVTITGDPDMQDQLLCAQNNCSPGNVTETGLTTCGPNMRIEGFYGADSTQTQVNPSWTPVGLHNDSACDINAPNVGTHDVTLYNVHASECHILSTRTTLSHVRCGPIINECASGGPSEDLMHAWYHGTGTNGGPPYVVSDSLTVDHSVIWWNPRCSSGGDTDTVHWVGTTGNSFFTNNIIGLCGSQNWTGWGPDGPSAMPFSGSITIANNFFNGSGAEGSNCVGSQFGQRVDWTGCTSNWTVEYNTFVGNKFTFTGCNNWTIRNNYIASLSSTAACSAEWPPSGTVVYDHNVFGTGSPAICGTNASRAAPTFVSPIGADIGDWNFTPTNSALSSGGTDTVYRATDIWGNTRTPGAVGAAMQQGG